MSQTVWGKQVMARARALAQYWYDRMVQALNAMMADRELEAIFLKTLGNNRKEGKKDRKTNLTEIAKQNST